MTQRRSGATSTDEPEGVIELSAGGAVVHASDVIVVVPVKRDAQGRRVLVLPKGHLDQGENDEAAAIREVGEGRVGTGREHRRIVKFMAAHARAGGPEWAIGL